MYPVTQAYLDAVRSNSRDVSLKIHIDTAFESLNLTDSDVLQGSFKLSVSGLSGDTMAPGGVTAADLSVTLLNKGGRYDDVQFNGALLTAQFGIKTASGDYEWMPLGTFNIDDVSRPTSIVTLGAMDNLLLFDVPFSDVGVTFPATNLQILSAICNHVGVTLKTVNFVNTSYTVQDAPDGSLSCRDILSDIAEMAAGFARCDYTGALEIVQWQGVGCVQEVETDGGTFAKDADGPYFDGNTLDGGNFARWNNKDYDGGVFIEPATAVSFGPTNRYNFSVDDSPVKVTGIELDADDQTYLVGTDYYAIHISDNKLIQGDPTDALNAMLDVFQNFAFLPFTSDWQGNPALQPGDIIEQIDRNGVHYRTIITDSSFAYRGKCRLQAKSASQLNQSYQPQLTKKVSQLVRSIHQKQVQLDTLDQAIVSATSMIAGALGGYFVNGDTLSDEQYHGNVFICDSVGGDSTHPDVTQAIKVWRWNLGGFGYSENGINGPFTTAITADGSIVANLVAAGIVTADLIKAGLLQSKDGSSWIDLDDGSFSFGWGNMTYDPVDGFNCVASKKIARYPWSGEYGQIGNTDDGFAGLDLYFASKIFARLLATGENGNGFSLDLNYGPHIVNGGRQCFGAEEGDGTNSLTYMQFGGGNGDAARSWVSCKADGVHIGSGAYEHILSVNSEGDLCIDGTKTLSGYVSMTLGNNKLVKIEYTQGMITGVSIT